MDILIPVEECRRIDSIFRKAETISDNLNLKNAELLKQAYLDFIIGDSKAQEVSYNVLDFIIGSGKVREFRDFKNDRYGFYNALSQLGAVFSKEDIEYLASDEAVKLAVFFDFNLPESGYSPTFYDSTRLEESLRRLPGEEGTVPEYALIKYIWICACEKKYSESDIKPILDIFKIYDNFEALTHNKKVFEDSKDKNEEAPEWDHW